MPIEKGSQFTERDIYVDYPFEDVMFRWDHLTKKIYRRFYGESEFATPIPHENRLFNDALLSGDEISAEVYFAGKPKQTDSTLPVVSKGVNQDGVMQYHVWADQSWEGFDTLVLYLQKKWNASVTESNDQVYSRRWVLRVSGVPISLYHDSQQGNYFLREDGMQDQTLLEKIESDLRVRLKG